MLPIRVPVADVLALYGAEIAPQTRATPKRRRSGSKRLLAFFGDKMLADINGDLMPGLCRKARTTPRGRPPRP